MATLPREELIANVSPIFNSLPLPISKDADPFKVVTRAARESKSTSFPLVASKSISLTPDIFKVSVKELTDKKLFQQHNAHWIPSGLPNTGKIMIFNNEPNRPDEPY